MTAWYTSRTARATCGQRYRRSTRAAPAVPIRRRRAASASSSSSAVASRSGRRGSTSRPVTPSTTVSRSPADSGSDDRDSAAHRLDRHDAEWLVPGRAGDHITGPHQVGGRVATELADEPAAVQRRSAAIARSRSVSASVSPARPPATHELGVVAREDPRDDHIGDALAWHHPPDTGGRWDEVASGAVGTDRPPHGTTVIFASSAPSLTSSDTSSRHVAITASVHCSRSRSTWYDPPGWCPRTPGGDA